MAPIKPDADKGEKEAKLTPEQSAAVIMDYLRKQNRPYSATDISSNLKNRVTKAAAAKILKDMHERNEIEGRAAGKQIVYHCIQAEPDDDAAQVLQAMDTRTTRLRETTTTLKAEEKELRLALRTGSSRIPLSELKATAAALKQQKDGMAARLTTLKGGNVKPVSLEERERSEKEWKKWQRTANARKKIMMEMWKVIEGHVEDRAAETKERLGLEF